MTDAEAHEMMRATLQQVEADLERDEAFLDEMLARFPDVRGQESADLRERINEGRMLRDRMARAIANVEEVRPWLREEG
jgi:hypothetical protein